MECQLDLSPDRQKIAQRFCKARQSYADAALVQSDICRQLVRLIRARVAMPTLTRVLEVGCGCGGLTQEFLAHAQPSQLYLNDLYPDIIHNNLSIPKENCHYLIGDVAAIDLPDGLEMILSASALQWIYPLDGLLARFYGALADGGHLAIGSFLAGNLQEIKTLTGQGLTYYDQDGLMAVLAREGFEVLDCVSETQTLHFPSAYAVLKHLQATGVTGGGEFRWTKQRLAQFEMDYRQFLTPEGFSLTYRPVLILAKKREK